MQVKHPIFWALLLPFILIIWLLLRGIRALLPKRDPVAEQEGASSAEYHRRRQMGYSGDEVESAWSRRVSEPTPPPPATPAPIPFSHPDRTAIADELLKLAKLKEQAVISEQEFADLKAALISEATQDATAKKVERTSPGSYSAAAAPLVAQDVNTASAYNVIIEGGALPGFAPDEVRARLAALSHQSEEAAAKLLSGQPNRVKSGVDQATATRYYAALAEIGVSCHVERETLGARGPDAPS